MAHIFGYTQSFAEIHIALDLMIKLINSAAVSPMHNTLKMTLLTQRKEVEQGAFILDLRLAMSELKIM